ncbi:hypothetical protein DFJ77DRAFT_439736 [Powellomyces hirtus]|nr:hypothetical protein DFJ77DRAFT_439736 [Powellomyces hirtus]
MFSQLAKLFAGSAPQAASKRILPSANFYDSIARANAEWLHHCLHKPVVCRGQKIHLLGISPVNVPTTTTLRTSLAPKLQQQGHPFGWICVDEAEKDATWLNRYATVMKRCPVSGEVNIGDEAHEDVEQLLEGVRTWSERIRHELLDEGTPEEWVEALVTTGLRPGWDVIEAVELAQEQNVPVEFIGMGSAEERQRIEMHLAQNTPSDGAASSVGSGRLEDGLRGLFESVGVSPVDLREIRSSGLSPFIESHLQNLVLGPNELARYNDLLAHHLTTITTVPTSRGSRERYRMAEARKLVRCERLVERLEDVCEEFQDGRAQGRDEVVLAVIDRNSVKGVTEMIKQLE